MPYRKMRRYAKKYVPKKVKKYVSKLVKRDGTIKTFYTANGQGGLTTTPGTTASVLPISNVIAIGGAQPNNSERADNTISPISVSARIQMKIDASNVTGEMMTVMLIRDSQSRGAVPTVAELSLVPNVAGAESTLFCPSADNYAKRFKVLKQFIVTFDTSQRMKFLKFTKRLSGKMYFDSSNGYQKNAIFLLIVGNNNTNKTVCNYSTRLLFRDK